MKLGNTIYLDHQASTPLDRDVMKEMLPFFGKNFGNPHSIDHFIGWQAARAVEIASEQVARLIGADKDEIIFTSGATEANNLAILGLGARSSDRRRILVSAIEHKCVLESSRILRDRFGFSLEVLPVDSIGRVDLQVLEGTLDDDVLMVSIMIVNNEIGTIQDIPKLSQVISSSGALFHCDAAQAPCAIDLSNMSQLVDLLSLSAHKMYGPQGIGALFARRELHAQIEPQIYGGGQQRNLRSGTMPVPLCVGMGAAATLLHSTDQEKERIKLRKKRDIFVERISALLQCTVVNGPQSSQKHPGNANIRFAGYSAKDLLAIMQPRIAASTGSACTSGIMEPSYVLQAIGLSENEAASSVRFSLGRETTEDCVEEAVCFIRDCIKAITI